MILQEVFKKMPVKYGIHVGMAYRTKLFQIIFRKKKEHNFFLKFDADNLNSLLLTDVDPLHLAALQELNAVQFIASTFEDSSQVVTVSFALA